MLVEERHENDATDNRDASLWFRVMLIRHLALTVRDPHASRDFYLQTIGLDGEASDEPWGVRVKFADGFMFALIQGDPPPASTAGAVHFARRLSRDGCATCAIGFLLRHEGVIGFGGRLKATTPA